MAREDVQLGEIVGTTPESISDSSDITIDRNSFLPFYRQIFDQIQELIKAGKISPGQPFWSEGAFAQKLGISKMTVRQAFQILRAEGLLVVEKGKRPLVGAGRVIKNFQELRGFSEEMKRRGLVPSTQLLAVVRRYPEPACASALRLGSEELIYWVKRLRYANKERVGVETTSLPARIFPGLEKQELEKESLYFIIENVYKVKPDWSEEELEAVPARQEEARLLQVKKGAPLFCMRRNVYSTEGAPIEYGISLFRGDRYRATVVSRRKI